MILSNREVRVLNEIRKIAAAGEPMPKGKMFAAMVAMSERATETAIRALKSAGYIRIDNPSSNTRIIHVDGMSTGAPRPITHCRTFVKGVMTDAELASERYHNAMLAYYERHADTHRQVLAA